MASFLQRAFMGLTGDVKGALRTKETVKIEKDPNDPEQDILRFGDGKDDYFPVKGNQRDKEALREILSKVIESPTQLKKIRDMDVKDRPTLIRDHGGKSNGKACAGYCNGDVISITPMIGTGYAAAGTFCHEFQHQYQNVSGNLQEWRFGKFKPSDMILNDRMFEAAADTANYQYLHEMASKNPQAAQAYAMIAIGCAGLRAYSAAKIKGKSEQDCILAGMTGYAKDFMTAKYYAESYHSDMRETDMKAVNSDYYSENVKPLVGVQYMLGAGGMRAETLDEVKAFKDHTTGMTTEPVDDKKVRKAMRAPEFNYVTPTVARAITRWAEKLKAAGKQITENPDKLNVRTLYGMTTNKERGGFAGLMFKAKSKMLSVVNKIKMRKVKDTLGARKSYSHGKVELILTADEQGKDAAKIGFSANGRATERDADKLLGPDEVEKRTLKAQQMFGILMKQPAFKRQVDEMHKNGVEIDLSFFPVREPRRNGNTIMLNPHQKPKELAEQFIRQFVPAVREGIAAKQAEPKQAEPKAETKVAEPKVEVKAAEPKAETKTAEPQQPQINGEVLLKMVDQLAFRTSKSNQSDTYYKPTPVETKLIDSLAKFSKDMVKSAGIDSRSAQAKPFRAKVLAEWAQSPQGKSGVTKLLQTYGKMQAFEKPMEKQPLMQALQAKARQAQPQQPVVNRPAVVKTQGNQR